MKWYALGACLLLCGCDNDTDIAQMSCADVASEAIRISEGKLVSIDHRTLDSKTPTRLTCHGVGSYKDAQVIPTRYEAIKNDNGEVLIRYDTSEYQAQQVAAAKAEAEREDRADRQEALRDYDEALQKARQSTQPY